MHESSAVVSVGTPLIEVGGSPLKGYVRVVEPGAFTKVSSLGANEAPERIASLGDGYRVEARITFNEIDNALLVPNSSLFRHDRLWHVLSISNGQATLSPV